MSSSIRPATILTRIRPVYTLPRTSRVLPSLIATSRYSTTPPQPSNPQPPPPHPQNDSQPQPPTGPKTGAGKFYKSFGSPILKAFLGALFTYQVVYWGWMKLESLEEVVDKEDEIAALKDELRQLLRKKAEAERLLAEKGESVVGKVEGTVKEAKKGWGLW